MLIAEEEYFHLFFEAPEGRSTEDIEVCLPSFYEVEEAEGIEDCMVPTEVRSVLLVTLTLVEIVLRVICVGN